MAERRQKDELIGQIRYEILPAVAPRMCVAVCCSVYDRGFDSLRPGESAIVEARHFCHFPNPSLGGRWFSGL